MEVKELIEILKGMPQDAEVYYDDSECGTIWVNKIIVDHDGDIEIKEV